MKLDGNSCLKEIGQKAKSLEEIEGQYMGLLRITPEGWHDIRRAMEGTMPRPMTKIDMTGLLSYLLSKGIKIEAVPYNGLWLEVDSQEDLTLYEKWEKNLE